jgi:HlyD family secretion protein
MKVDCAVDEADVGNVKEGMQIRFSVDAFSGETFVGRLVQVREGADTDQGVVTYNAEVQVDNPEAKLMPGMTALVYIYTAHEHDVLTIPNAALKFKPSPPSTTPSKSAEAAGVKPGSRRRDSTVWILDARGNLIPLQVKTGITDNIRTEVLAGNLKEGDRIVTGSK